MDHFNDKFLLLLEANRILTSTLETSKLLSLIIKLAQKVVNAEASSLLLLDENTNELYFNIITGSAANAVKKIRLQPGEGIAGWCAFNNKSLIVEDVTKDNRWTQRVDDNSGFKTKSIICVPMKYKNQVIGVIEGINAVGAEFFTDSDLPFFEAFANQAALALENSRLFTKLTQEKEKISVIYDGMSEAVFAVSTNGVILQANKSAFNLVNSTEIVGSSFAKIITDVGFELPTDFLEFIEKTRVFEIVKKSGKIVFLHCAATKIINSFADDSGKIDGYILVIKDITSEKKENLLKRSFLSLISHKLKTPLVSIVGYLSFLADEHLESNHAKAVSMMKDQSERLTNLVEDLLRFTAVESATLELEKEKVSVEKIVLETLDKMGINLKNVDITISDLSIAGEVFVDKEKIKEALRCIIENAVKFNEKPKKIVKITCQSYDNKIILNIEDNGDGILLSEGEKIFDKFYQIEESFTGQVAGAGLGLSLAKRIIDAHGGQISVDSKIGEGSLFTIVLPRWMVE